MSEIVPPVTLSTAPLLPPTGAWVHLEQFGHRAYRCFARPTTELGAPMLELHRPGAPGDDERAELLPETWLIAPSAVFSIRQVDELRVRSFELDRRAYVARPLLADDRVQLAVRCLAVADDDDDDDAPV